MHFYGRNVPCSCKNAFLYYTPRLLLLYANRKKEKGASFFEEVAESSVMEWILKELLAKFFPPTLQPQLPTTTSTSLSFISLKMTMMMLVEISDVHGEVARRRI